MIVPLHGKRDFADASKLIALEMGRAPCLIQVGPIESLKPLKAENFPAAFQEMSQESCNVRTGGRDGGRGQKPSDAITSRRQEWPSA